MADDLVEEYSRQYPGRLADQSWGKLNVASIRHPLSASIPVLGRFLNMPTDPLPGDENKPRVQSRSFGASERFAVSPGGRRRGISICPAGRVVTPCPSITAAVTSCGQRVKWQIFNRRQAAIRCNCSQPGPEACAVCYADIAVMTSDNPQL